MLLRTIVALLEGPRTDSPRTPEAVRPGSVVCRPLRATYVFALYAHVLRLWGACRMRDVGHGRQQGQGQSMAPDTGWSSGAGRPVGWWRGGRKRQRNTQNGRR